MNERCATKRGRPAKPLSNPSFITEAVIQFLKIFMPETLAKRIVSIVLIAVGIPNPNITERTGLSDRTIWTLKKAIKNGNIGDLFVVRHRSGRPGKAKGFEHEITLELEKSNYHTRQQVADMIFEKFGIKMSVSAVGKLLKKTASGD